MQLHKRLTIKKEKQKIYVHSLFYINNDIHKSNNYYYKKISITGCVILKLLLININIVIEK